MASPSRAAFGFVFATVLLDMLALGVMVPVLPKLILQLEGGDITRASNLSGWFGSLYAAIQLFAAPLLGSLSDRFGRRPVILLSNLGLGLDYLLMALAPSLGWLLAGRVLSGVSSGSVPAASAYIADVTPPEQRAARFGMLGAAFGLGFIIGPAIGGLLGAIDLRLPFWVSAALSLLNFLYGALLLPESLPPERRAPLTLQRLNPLGALSLFSPRSGLFGLAAACALYYLAHEALPSVFVLYTGWRYHWEEATVGVALAIVGVCSTVVSAGLIGPVVRRLGEARTASLGLGFGAAGMALYGLAPTTAWFLAGIPLVGLWGLTGPAMQARLSQRTPAAQQGQLQGALGGLRGITGLLGPLLFTRAFSTAIAPHSPLPYPGLPYLLAAGLLLASLLLTWRARPTPTPTPPV